MPFRPFLWSLIEFSVINRTWALCFISRKNRWPTRLTRAAMIYFSPKGTFANRVGQKNRAGNPSRANIDMVNRITWKWNEKHKKIARSLLSRVNERFCRLISFRLIMHLRTYILSRFEVSWKMWLNLDCSVSCLLPWNFCIADV